MPELPEVETIVRQLRPLLVGRTFRSLVVRCRLSVTGQPAALRRGLLGARVVGVWRRAKFFVFNLERAGRPAGRLVGHLRMTGRLLLVKAGKAPERFERVSLGLDNGAALVFADVRKFGRLVYVPEGQEPFPHLGPEPLGRGFAVSHLSALLAARRRALKPLLLDQTLLAGLGNIYVDESLHRAGLHPLLRSDRVSATSVRRLHTAIRAVLRTAIRREGSSFDAFYRTPEGQPGRYQERFLVYGRAGLPCHTCGTRIVRTVVGQRGTHHCPRCQPRPRSRAGSR